MSPPRVEVFADVGCPFTHVGLRRLVAARAARGVDVLLDVRAWPLEWVNDAPLDPHHVGREVVALREQVAPELFTGFSTSSFPASSIPALALAAAARARDPRLGEAVSLDLRLRLFEDGGDVADPALLAVVAAAHGITVPDPETALALVRADHEEGTARGVVGSPHFFVGDEGWFCPTLHISRDEAGDFHVTEDTAASQRLLDHLLGGDLPGGA